MNTDIRYIFLDLGGTFRVIDKDPAYLAAARAKIAELCGVKDGRSYPVVRGRDRQAVRCIPGMGAEIYVRGPGRGAVAALAGL